jgi:ParB family chromosome partitioning protein
MELDERYADVIVKRYIEQKGSDTDVYLMRDTQKTAYRDVKKSVE